ncbi:MAG: PHP domain-containing protein [Anaerolineae bacterium]|nr:PHP domain-containing protein [Anaerolineae bacterium]
MIWKVETHAHTMWSGDSLTRPETIVRMCRERQITRIAITDHNTAEGALFLKHMAPGLVIVGEEIMTSEGELLAWYVRESVPAGMTPAKTIRNLRNQGAVISVSHPFDRLRRGAWRQDQLERIIDKVDAIEVFNARCVYASDNERALAFARQHGMTGSVGSDAHYGPEYGQTLQLTRPFEDDPLDFLDALLSSKTHCKRSSHLVHLSSTVAKWIKRTGFRQPRHS